MIPRQKLIKCLCLDEERPGRSNWTYQEELETTNVSLLPSSLKVYFNIIIQPYLTCSLSSRARISSSLSFPWVSSCSVRRKVSNSAWIWENCSRKRLRNLSSTADKSEALMCSSEMVPVVPPELFAALIGGGDLKQMMVIRSNPNMKLHIENVRSTAPPESTALHYRNNVTTSVVRVDFYTADRDRIIPRQTCSHLASYMTTSYAPSRPTNQWQFYCWCYIVMKWYIFLNNQPDALIIQIYSVIKLYMFRASSLPIIRSFLPYIQHW